MAAAARGGRRTGCAAAAAGCWHLTSTFWSTPIAPSRPITAVRRVGQGARETARSPSGCSDLVASGFVRVVTNQRLWRPATEPAQALVFVDRLRRRRACRILAPGSGTWTIFARLVASAGARGKLVADAYLAALAIEHGCTLATCDSDFARFADLRWSHPLQPGADVQERAALHRAQPSYEQASPQPADHVRRDPRRAARSPRTTRAQRAVARGTPSWSPGSACIVSGGSAASMVR